MLGVHYSSIRANMRIVFSERIASSPNIKQDLGRVGAMNPTIAYKLGEVLAFARVGQDSITKAKGALSAALKDDEVENINATLKDFEQQIEDTISTEDIADEVHDKAKEAEDKITKMRDTYLGGQWDDQSEALEWMGFFSGAALVHWYLLAGAAEKMDNAKLTSMTKEAIDFYAKFFTNDEQLLKKLGAQSVQE